MQTAEIFTRIAQAHVPLDLFDSDLARRSLDSLDRVRHENESLEVLGRQNGRVTAELPCGFDHRAERGHVAAQQAPGGVVMRGITRLVFVIDAAFAKHFVVVVHQVLKVGGCRLVQAHVNDKSHCRRSLSWRSGVLVL